MDDHDAGAKRAAAAGFGARPVENGEEGRRGAAELGKAMCGEAVSRAGRGGPSGPVLEAYQEGGAGRGADAGQLVQR